MALITEIAELKLNVKIYLDEDEIRALNILSKYNSDSLIKALESVVGERKEHREGLKKFFNSINEYSYIIEKADRVRKEFILK